MVQSGLQTASRESVGTSDSAAVFDCDGSTATVGMTRRRRGESVPQAVSVGAEADQRGLRRAADASIQIQRSALAGRIISQAAVDCTR